MAYTFDSPLYNFERYSYHWDTVALRWVVCKWLFDEFGIVHGEDMLYTLDADYAYQTVEALNQKLRSNNQFLGVIKGGKQ